MTRSFFLLFAGAIAIGFAPILFAWRRQARFYGIFGEWRCSARLMDVREAAERRLIRLVAFRSSLVWLAGLAFALDLLPGTFQFA
jgi:hypothetical protein